MLDIDRSLMKGRKYGNITILIENWKAGPEGCSDLDKIFRTLDPSVKSRLLYLAELRAR